MHEFGFYEYFMTILVGLVMICIGWSMINYPGVAQMIAQETQEAIMDLPNAWMNLGDGQGQQPPEEVENEPMEVEPEGLQGIWADPGPPVMMRARGAGRGRGRGRPRGRLARGRARGPPQQAPFPQVPQQGQAEEPEEPINHPGAPGVVFPADMTYGDISQALVDEAQDLLDAEARSVEDLVPGLREFRAEAAERATELLEPQMDTADEGEGEEEERQEDEEMESEAETEYGSVEMALEAQMDYMHTTAEVYNAYRRRQIDRGNGVEVYLNLTVERLRRELAETTHAAARLQIATELEQFLQIQWDVENQDQRTRLEAIQFLVDDRREEFHFGAQRGETLRARNGWRGQRFLFELRARELV